MDVGWVRNLVIRVFIRGRRGEDIEKRLCEDRGRDRGDVDIS